MVAVAEVADVVMRFKIRILVNHEALERGDVLTRPERDERGCAVKRAKPTARITPGDILKENGKRLRGE